jgi:F-type H+-transporting ATPase subunit gamma
MASGREIKTKIKSTQNMRKVIAHVTQANTDFSHPFLLQRDPVARVGYIVVSTDRGLCGGLNSNLFRRLLPQIHEWQQQHVQVDVVAIGQKAVQFFSHIKGVNLIGSVGQLGEQPKLEKLIGAIKIMLDAYRSNGVQRVFLAYNDFVNTMVQKPTIDALLPLPLVAAEMEAHQAAGESAYAGVALERAHTWDYLYEPDAETVLGYVLDRYIESVVYQASLENLASEHAARMVAMKGASDNANKVIDELTLSYNKARQAAITQEIS